MTEPTIRKGIVDAIQSKPKAGMVFDHIPWSATWDVHLEQFKCRIGGVNMLRGFTVSLISMPQDGEILEDEPDPATRTHNYEVLGYQGISQSQETETSFLEVVLEVMEAIDSKNLSTHQRDRSQLISYRPDMVGSALCHVARISVPNIRETVGC